MIRRLLLALLLLLPFEAQAVINMITTSGFAAAGTGLTTVTLPVTTANNDIVILFCESSNEAITVSTSGYTEQDTQASMGTGTGATAGSVRLAVFWKRSTGGETTAAVNDSGDHTFVTAVIIKGAITSGNPFDVSTGSVQLTAATAVSWQSSGMTYSNGSTLTTTVPGTLIVGAIANATDVSAVQVTTETLGTINNLTELSDNNNTTTLGGGIATIYGYKGAAGVVVDTGSNNFTATLATSSKYAMFLGAIKPAAASGPLYSGSTVSVNSANAISTLTLPAGLVTNDITILVVESSAQTITAPSGYTEIDTQASMATGSAAGIGSLQMAIFYKRYVGGDTAPTVADSGDHQIAQIFAFTNVTTSGNPYDVLGVGVNATAAGTFDWTNVNMVYGTGAGTVTSTVNNTLVLTIVANGQDTITLQTASMTCPQLTGYLQLGDANCTNGTGGGFGIAAGEMATAGNIVNTSTHSFGGSFTASTSNKYALAVIALKPPVTGITAQQKAGFFMLMP